MLRYVQRSYIENTFEKPEGMSSVMHRLLMQRGISSAAEAAAFLHPGVDQLHDPYLLSDMQPAVDRIREAIEKGQHICIYGDYDVDGVSASAIMYLCLTEAGADAEVYLPSRHSEGYGLNEAAVREIAERSSLLITVDCGIASHDLIELAKSLGLGCIVTDHHRPGEILPECPVINPLLNDYPFPWLCGAGVAFKTVQALCGTETAMEYIDLAAVATVADVVSLTDENRAIVYLGLRKLNSDPRPGLQALMDCARIEKGGVTSETIAFRIAPRLNAGGRLGSARRSYELLVQPDSFLAVAQADELETENSRRQAVERQIRAEAERQLADYDFSAHRIIIVKGEGWNSGVIGLAASHLREKYHYPVIVFSEEDGLLTGSCRSIEGVDIYQTLCSAAHLLEKFGGHAQAAGLTLKSENLDELQRTLDTYLSENIPKDAWLPFAEYDLETSVDAFTEPLVRSLAALEPTGCGNPEPVFRANAHLIEARAIGAEGAHLRLLLSENGMRRTGIFFGAGELLPGLYDTAEILFTPQLNLWNGRTDVQLRISALRNTNISEQIDAERSTESVIQRKFLTELFYNKGINTKPEEPISLPELKNLMLHSGPQGTLILCGDLDTAAVVANSLQPLPPDLYIGHLPDDPRGYNGICVCPERMDHFPRALRRLILAGTAAPAGIPESAAVYALDCAPAYADEFPDVDAMREVYKAALYLSRRPVYIPDAESLDLRLGETCGLSPVLCRLSLLALMDMQLVELREKPFALRVPPAKKTDPDSSAVWRSIQAYRKIVEGRHTLEQR